MVACVFLVAMVPVNILIYTAWALNAITTVLVLILLVLGSIWLRTKGNRNLALMADSLPKVVDIIAASSIPVEVLVAVAEECAIDRKKLQAHFEEAHFRAAVVKRVFGSDKGIVGRYIKSAPDFITSGYTVQQKL